MRNSAFAAAAATALLLVPHLAQAQVGGLIGGIVGRVGSTVNGVGSTVGGVVGTVGNTVSGVGGMVAATAGTAGSALGGASGATGIGTATPGTLTTASLPSGAGSSSGPNANFATVPSISLPASLAPLDLVGAARFTALFPDLGRVSGTREDLARFRIPLRARSGTPQQVVKNCRDAITAAALPYGVVRVDAASAGPMRSAGNGFVAPVEFRIIYNRRGGLEARQATVSCRLNVAGRVVAAA